MHNKAVLTNILQRRHLSADLKKYIYDKKFQLVVNFIDNESVIASPEIALSNKHPKYLTLQYCLICTSSYFVSSFKHLSC